ncbi:hypothetical protein ACOCEA_09310 [Maribacter sp. CXY002]|uniref:hypothetical protein n=1 Tax=Maribacter luteocoastalis TaxID=3407671 RepID=UPI003B67A8D2
MKNVTTILKNLGVLALGLLVTYSCSDDAETENEVQLTQTEVKAILEADDVSGAVDTVLSELYMNNGTTGKSSSANDCYSAEYTDTGYVATFNNCVLNGTDNINGTLTVTYNLESETASYTANYVDFYVGEIKINGTRTYVLSGNSTQNSISFSVTSDMSLILEDGSEIAENGTKTFGITFGDSLETSTFTIDGSWVLFLDGNTYSVTVNSVLQGNFSCSYLNMGAMTVNKNGLAIDVDFGDGTCDDIATITYPNGVEEEITLRD